MQPRLIVEQKITPLVNRYAVHAVTASGEKGELLAFAQQKRLAFKEQVDFYTDESRQTVAFTLRAEKVMDVHGRYFVLDSNGERIGAFGKDFKKSLLNSTWHIIDAQDRTLMTVNESNQLLAVLRRFGDMLPFVGLFIELLTLVLRYHFVFRSPDVESEQGMYRKTTLLRDHYQLDMTDDAYSRHDWRTLAALAVALDALQSR